MAGERILVVEDNAIVAKVICKRVETLGYTVSGTARTAQQALDMALEYQPDLILMDIKLRGPSDGIEAAQGIRKRIDVPVVYLTAYADEETIQRAKATGPFGYIVKPFEENALRSNIEIALFKHKLETSLRKSRQWLATILKCIGEGTIATDASGCVQFMNPAAEALTGWSEQEVLGRQWEDVLKLVDERTGRPASAPLKSALEKGKLMTLSGRTCLVDRRGSQTPVDVVSAPIIDQADNLEGAVLLFKDSSERKVAEDALQQDRALLKAALDGLSDAVFLRSLDGLLVLVNTAGTRLLGRPEKGLLGKDGNELFGRRAAALIEQAHQRVLATGEAQRFRCEIPVNGVERVFEVTESVGQSKEGEAAGVVAVLRDSEPLAGRAPGSSRERSMARDTRRQPTVEEMDRRLDTVRHRLETFKSEWGQGTAPEQLSEIEQQLASLSDILRGMSGLHRRRRNPSRST